MNCSIGEAEDMVLTTSTNPKKKEKDNSNLSLISRCSSTDSEQGGQEPGCSTRLLESDNYQPFVIHLPQSRQSTSADTDSNYSLRTRKSSLNNCPLDVLFFHWNWAGLRLGCFVVFVCVLVGMFCVVLRSVTSQTSHCVPARGWWQGTVSYEIFPASFQDSDGDGFGDFAGLRWRLDYVQKQNVASVRLNSIFSALDYPLEYTHVIDFKNVDPHLGRISDFEELVQDIHARGLHVILDINPTLTSDQHPWAAHWQQNKSGEYQHFYIEVNESKGKLMDTRENLVDEKENPNRPFGGQLFLNWSHQEVQRKMNSAFEFWLQKGVDGFYIKDLELLQVGLERDLYIVMKHWRILLDKYSSDTKKNILLVSFPFLQTLKETRSRFLRSLLNFCDIIDFQLNFNLSNPLDLKVQLNVADEWSALSPSSWVNWHLGSAETTRLSTRLDANYTLSTMLLLLVLPGSISLFYGDEINLRDSLDILTGKGYREGQLCPMQWTSSTESNFTKNGTPPWLPINPEFSSQNVEERSAEISLISQLIALRNKSPSLWMKAIYDGKSAVCDGRPFTYVLHPGHGSVVILERYFPTKERYVVGVNLERKPVTIDFTEFVSEAHILFSTNKEIGEKPFKEWNVQNVSLNLGDVFVAETND
ncbi:neutral and basic amino acid transport protein rBAT-like [Limulus polyphemus]|uniref:Neutral and basic amino acid transport protein rBAT-like n=1 Tax=Limulus polyphemus TaxID=6850 RepID=A0ABM1B0K3_LIMPO|nr:neutral and basic amino acid transport protein rBAT-like [Limulus polyphemus]XP_022239100.1 neutral and basic amino acid transport protein rBAT-like [Limulus polyphemus]